MFVCSLVDSQDLVIKMVSYFAFLFFVSFDLYVCLSSVSASFFDI